MYYVQVIHFANINSFYPGDKFVFLEGNCCCSLELGEGRSGCRVSIRLLVNSCFLPWRMRGCLCTCPEMIRKDAWVKTAEVSLTSFFTSKLTS